MKKLAIILVFFSVACGGSLSDEQRKKMKEQMELHKIKRVTEVEITEAAYREGRKIMKTLSGVESNPAKKDSLIKAYDGRVRWIVPGEGNAIALEQQLVDAYLADASGELTDNIQKIRRPEGESDSILYTQPVVTRLPDGTDRLEGVWNIWLSKKQLILEMDK